MHREARDSRRIACYRQVWLRGRSLKRKGPHPNRAAIFVWDGDAMIPLPRFKRLCDQLYAVHEEYPLVVLENRSQASHNHYFAALAEAHANLAEEYARKYPTPEHMRSSALVEEGYCTETDHVLDTPKDAKAFAIMLRRAAPYSIIKISGSVVKEFQPVSQSRAAMKKQPFEDSKAAVLARVAAWSRTTPAQLNREADRQVGKRRA